MMKLGVFCVILCSLVLLFQIKGASQFISFETVSSQYSSELDKCITESIDQLSTPDCAVYFPFFRRPVGSSLINTHSIKGESNAKITDPLIAERHVIEKIEQIIFTLNNLPQIRPYLETFPVNVNQTCYYVLYDPKDAKEDEHYIDPYISSSMYNYVPKQLTVSRYSKDKKEKFDQPFVTKNVHDVPELKALIDVAVPRKKEKPVRAVSYINADKTIINRKEARYFCKFLEQYCKESGFQISCAIRSALDGDYRPIAAGLWAKKELNLEQAKELANSMFTLFYKENMTNNKDLIYYRDINIERKKWPYKSTNWLCFRVTFWDDFLNRVEEPYIAQILCQDDIIRYYTADEGQRLIQIYEEPVPKVEEIQVK